MAKVKKYQKGGKNVLTKEDIEKMKLTTGEEGYTGMLTSKQRQRQKDKEIQNLVNMEKEGRISAQVRDREISRITNTISKTKLPKQYERGFFHNMNKFLDGASTEERENFYKLKTDRDIWDSNANNGRGGLKKGYNLVYSMDADGRISLSVEGNRGDVIHQVKADQANQEGAWENLGTGFEGRLREGYNDSLEPIGSVSAEQMKSDTVTLPDGRVVDPKLRPGDPGFLISDPKSETDKTSTTPMKFTGGDDDDVLGDINQIQNNLEDVNQGNQTQLTNQTLDVQKKPTGKTEQLQNRENQDFSKPNPYDYGTDEYFDYKKQARSQMLGTGERERTQPSGPTVTDQTKITPPKTTEVETPKTTGRTESGYVPQSMRGRADDTEKATPEITKEEQAPKVAKETTMKKDDTGYVPQSMRAKDTTDKPKKEDKGSDNEYVPQSQRGKDKDKDKDKDKEGNKAKRGIRVMKMGGKMNEAAPTKMNKGGMNPGAQSDQANEMAQLKMYIKALESGKKLGPREMKHYEMLMKKYGKVRKSYGGSKITLNKR